MPIISKIGRRSVKVRLLVWSIYGVLVLGSTTMIYPFLLMLAGSTKSNVDVTENRVVPSFVNDDTALYRKHIEGLFNENLILARCAYQRTFTSFEKLTPPPAVNDKLVAEWEMFLREANLPVHTYGLGYTEARVTRGVQPRNLRAFRAQLERRFDGDLHRMNREMQTEFPTWVQVARQPSDFRLRRARPVTTPFEAAFAEFKSRSALADRYYFSIEGFYKENFLKTQYSKDIAKYNEAHDTTYTNWDDVHLDRTLPGPGRTDSERADWTEFTRSLLNLFWIRADDRAAPGFRRFLLAKYGSIDAVNRVYGTKFTAIADVPFPGACPPTGAAGSDWEVYLQGWRAPDTRELHIMPTDALRIHSTEFLFRDRLKAKYGTIANANAAFGTAWRTWLDVLPPQHQWHHKTFLAQRRPLRTEFLTRNFATVFDYVIRHGRAILNTIVYCGCAILCALLINPLAAYALSRYKPPSAYKVLLFLMLTMAFPPMVNQIPVFLMLREFQLLNTYWALILPAVANGYSIFLLKGFFDSLPQELYESAAIDGAGEFRIFWQITMSLSKPILAVIALQTFTMTYGNFMMALLVCQDRDMWTVMPWLYQLQQYGGPGVIFASLIIAAVPTFLIFVFCQNIIMRGIVVPVEK